MTVLFVNHNDSFVHNLINWFKAHYKPGVQVVNCDDLNKNRQVNLLENITAVVLSPGPGHPHDYAQSLSLYKNIPPHIPVLGVCLGFQIMLHAHKADVVQLSSCPVHGQQVKIEKKIKTHFLTDNVLQGLFVLYNSWGVLSQDAVFKNHFNMLVAKNGVALVAEHKTLPHVCVQFHPESFASTGGERFLHSFLRSFYIC